MSYEMIALLMFRVDDADAHHRAARSFAAIGSVAVIAALLLWGEGGSEMGFSAAMKLMKWYPLLTLPMFHLHGFSCSRSPASRTISTGCFTCGSGRCGAASRSAPSG